MLKHYSYDNATEAGSNEGLHMTGMEVLLNAWNGPFSLGPLAKPIVPMDAVMKILEVIWKAAFILVSLWAALVIGFLALHGIGIIR
jgi:hypothetical protein